MGVPGTPLLQEDTAGPHLVVRVLQLAVIDPAVQEAQDGV